MKSFLSRILLSVIAAVLVAVSSSFSIAPAFTAQRTSRVSLFMAEGENSKGTVKWFNVQKGYGFVIQEGDGAEHFVHQTAILAEGFRSLADGEEVEFKVVTDDNGRTRAVDVTGPGGAEPQGAPFRPESDFNAY